MPDHARRPINLVQTGILIGFSLGDLENGVILSADVGSVGRVDVTSRRKCMILSPRLKAQAGLAAAAILFVLTMSIVVGGAFQKPTQYTGMIGSPATPFRLADLKNHYVSLASMRGSVVVLCFTSDPDSTLADAETRRLHDLGQQYADRSDVKVVAVCSDADMQSYPTARAVKSLAAAAGDACLTLLDPTSSVSHDYSVDKRPTFLVIDPQGVIRYRGEMDDVSDDAPLASVSFPAMIDLLRDEKNLGRTSTPAVLSNIK
jgi:peroxiredoxin